MSDEEEVFNDDAEFQNTQKEIEELRKKEEELMTKMTELAKKRKSASDNSLDDNEEDEHENIGRRRRPSLSRGSSPTKPQKRPDSITLSHESGTFRSRGSSSSTSPTKDARIRSISPTKKGVSSRTSSRSSSTSPTKTQARSTISVTSSRSSSASPVKESNRMSDHGYKISICSPTKETKTTVGASTGARSPTKGSQVRKTSPKKSKTGKQMSRSMSTPAANVKDLKDKKVRRRGSGELDGSRSSTSERADNSGIDLLVDLGGDGDVKDIKASSTGNLSSVDVPENEIVKRGKRGSRSSVEGGRSRNSMNINEDSYEIIEIDCDTQKAPSSENLRGNSSPRRGKDNLTARQKIEQELAEQVKKEEELKRLHTAAQDDNDDKGDGGDENEDREEDDLDDIDDEDLRIEPEEEEEEVEVKVESLTAKQKIEKELAEQKLREEELRLSHVGSEKMIDADEEYRKEEDELLGEEEEDVVERDPDEGSEEEEAGNKLSTWEKIALEIEEEKRREEERKKSLLEEESSDEEEEVEDADTRQRVRLEIEGLVNGDDQGDSGEESQEEEVGVVSVQDRIEREIKEIEERERELKKTQANEEEEDEEEEDEGIEDSVEEQGAAKSKIQQEIEEFKQKESELRKSYGVEDDENDSDNGVEDQRKDTISMIEWELAEQRRKEMEYRNQHLKGKTNSQVDQSKAEKQGEDLEDDQSNGSLEDDLLDEGDASSTAEDFEQEEKKVTKEVVTSHGITRKYIKMFSTDGDKISRRQREEMSDDDSKPVRKGESKAEELAQEENSASEDDDVDQNEDLNIDVENVQKETKKKTNTKRNTTMIQSVTPGKKLVLKRKKSKKSDEEEQKEGIETEVVSKVTVADTRKSFEKQKEQPKPVKKAHPLAMHWEKIQEQHRNEAVKNDMEATRKKQEAEKKRKKEFEQKQQTEKEKQKLEIKELQDRRRSLAEAWENKNNNEENLKVVKKIEKTEKTTKVMKNVSGKVSPRKSPGKKKETNTRAKLLSKEETPKSARANIKLWEQRIASSSK